MDKQGVYIHLTWEGYKKNNTSSSILNYQQQTRSTYLEAAARSNNNILAGLGVDQGSLARIVDGIEEVEKKWTTQSGFQKLDRVFKSGTEEAIKAGMNLNKQTSNIEKTAEKMLSGLKPIGGVLNNMPTLDKRLSNYLKSGAGVKDSAINGNSLSLITYDKVIISLLKKTIQEYSKINSETDVIPLKNELVKKVVSTEIQRALIESFLSGIGVKDPTISNNEKAINYSKSENGFNIKCTNGQVSIGYNGSKSKGVTAPTTSIVNLPTQMEEILKEAALLDSAFEYNLFNLMAHHQRVDDLNKFITARTIVSNLTKVNGITFLASMDRLIDLHNLYQGMEISNPQYSFSDSNDLGPGPRLEGGIASAFIRSSLQVRKYLNLRGSINKI